MPPRESADEFYTGYLPTAPAGIAAHVRRAVIALLVAAAVIALTLTAAQAPFGPGIFEFQIFRSFEGIAHTQPYPHLAVTRPGVVDGEPATSRFYLVAPGKFGADDQLAEVAGHRVRLEGSLIYRDDQTMVEIKPGSVATSTGSPPPPAAETSHGMHTLIGEIVDSKCHLGLMKPGSRKTHRACAVRCISGGIPPIFLVRDAQGPAAHLLLVGSDGRAVGAEVLDRVAEPLEITGEIVRLDDLWILKADPSNYRRLL